MGLTYKRVIYVNEQYHQAYEIAFTMGRYAMCKQLDYETYKSPPTSLLTRFKRGWGKLYNKNITLYKKIIEEEVKR